MSPVRLPAFHRRRFSQDTRVLGFMLVGMVAESGVAGKRVDARRRCLPDFGPRGACHTTFLVVKYSWEVRKGTWERGLSILEQGRKPWLGQYLPYR